jgi:hypothetical protein
MCWGLSTHAEAEVLTVRLSLSSILIRVNGFVMARLVSTLSVHRWCLFTIV